jgi:hypothetical protein
VGYVERLKVLAAALALRDFTVDEISGLSGVNTRTVSSVLQRSPSLFSRADAQTGGESAVSAHSGRGRPPNHWTVVDGDQVRRLINESGALPRFEPRPASIGEGGWREVAVAVAEDALAQAASEPDEALQGRLIGSARSSLFLGNEATSQKEQAPWWEGEDSSFAVRARGVDALATLANLEPAQHDKALGNASRQIADAMQAIPEHGEETYFAPFARILARSGEFAPLFAVCARDQEPGFPFAGSWTEVPLVGFQPTLARVVTQDWATPLVNVASSMPIVVSASVKTESMVDQVIVKMRVMPRPAMVFGSLNEHGLIEKSGLAGASFVPVGSHSLGRQEAIESVAAVIDRFSAGR